MAAQVLSLATPRPARSRPADKFKVNVYTELKRLVAADCMNLMADKDLRVQQQQSLLFDHFHGKFGRVPQSKKFIEGKEIYQNAFETVDSIDGPIRIVPERLHRCFGSSLIVGVNLTEVDVASSRLVKGNNNPPVLTGRTLRSYAIDAVREAKKMLSLMDEAVKAKIVTKVDGEYEYYSGKTIDDVIEFILFRMYNWKHFNGDGDIESNPQNEEDHTNEEHGGSSPESEGDDSEEHRDDYDPLIDDLDARQSVNSPPSDYLPIGFLFFMLRGPLADEEYRMDKLSIDQLDSFINGDGRAASRKQEAAEKFDQRDFERGTATTARQERGIAFGSGTQLEIATVSQTQARIVNQDFEQQLVQHDILIRSRGDQLKAELEMAKLYRDMDII
eukprot:scaffold87013_cov49-Cyclotella_meneghiniana.AAC.2